MCQALKPQFSFTEALHVARNDWQRDAPVVRIIVIVVVMVRGTTRHMVHAFDI